MRMAFILFSLAFFSPSAVQTQAQPGSEVFKSFKAPRPGSLIEPSDITYQMWQGFQLTQKANAGDPIAQHELGIRYLIGRGFRPDTARSALWIRKAAEGNVLPARYNLAILQWNGWGEPWNPFGAYENFRYCAENELPDAQYLLAQFLTENLVVQQNWDEAYRWVRRAAEAKYKPAQEGMKMFLKKGYPNLEDTSASFFAPKDSPSLQTSQTSTSGSGLGVIFLSFNEDTLEIVSDETLVQELLRDGTLALIDLFGMNMENLKLSRLDSTMVMAIEASAETGSPEALVVLGRLYEEGFGKDRDAVIAAVHYVRAVRLDSPRAMPFLLRLLRERDFFSRLRGRVNRNDLDARYLWASFIALGLDRQLTDGQALEMLRIAAEKDHAQSQIEMGLCYYAGRWVKKDLSKAIDWWSRAAANGNGEAKLRIALTDVVDGRGSSIQGDFIPTLDEASRKGSILAQVALAYCFESGNGVTKNKGEAARLNRTAAHRGSQDAYRALRRMHDGIRPNLEQYHIR